MIVHEVGEWARVIHGEALESLRQIPDDCIDALCTDPPGGIAFMPATNDWDCFRRKHNPNDVGRDSVFGRTSATSPHSRGESERNRFVAFLTPIMAEAFRVLKPGAYGLVWAHSKTAYWTAQALDDAGFKIRERVFHLHAQGGAKCLNVAKAIDQHLGAEPTVVGPKPWKNQDIRGGRAVGGGEHEQLMDTTPTTPEAQQWDGWYSGIKPAVEEWILVQKPFKGTIVENVLKNGVGAVNVGATSVARAPDDVPGWHESGSLGRTGFVGTSTFRIRDMSSEEVKARRAGKGRFTPNLLLSHHDLCVKVGTTRVKGCPQTVIQGGKDGGGYDVGSGDGSRRGIFEGYGDENGMEEVDLWACVPGCPVRSLEIQGARGKKEEGKSRYFPQFHGPWLMTPKPGRSEKEAGLDHLDYATLTRVNPGGLERESRYAPVKVKNNHTTVKSIPLCRWLTRLVCPPDGIVLDMFAGSGSIGAACALEGFRYFGIEQGNPPGDDRYIQIILGRLAYWKEQAA